MANCRSHSTKPTWRRDIDVEETDYGVRIFSTRNTDKGRTFFRVTNFILPNKATIPGPMSGDGYNLYWHVPIDDTHHWRYDIVFRRSAPMEEKDIQRNQEILDELTPGLPAEAQQGESLPAGSRVDEDVEFFGHGTDLQRAGHRYRRRQRTDRRPHAGNSSALATERSSPRAVKSYAPFATLKPVAKRPT